MSLLTLTPLFYLLADHGEHSWNCAVAAWCDHGPAPALCLTNNPEHATGYLIIARHSAQVAAALRDDADLAPGRPTVWINDHTGRVLSADSPESLLRLVMEPDQPAPLPLCQCGRGPALTDDAFAWCAACDADFQASLDHLALSEAA